MKNLRPCWVTMPAASAAMLQQQQGVVNQLVDWRFADHTHDSTHVSIPQKIKPF